MDNNIALVISKAIKEKKWLNIKYQNYDNNITHFWCAINDIDIENKKLLATSFNIQKITNEYKGIIDVEMHFTKIINAQILDGTTYLQNECLIKKIEDNITSLQWLKYDLYNEKIFTYLLNCIKYDTISYQMDYKLVKEIDNEVLANTGLIKLNDFQIAEITNGIEYIKKNRRKEEFELALNILSLNDRNVTNGLNVIAYKVVKFNPRAATLEIEKDIHLSPEFIVKENNLHGYSLYNYMDEEKIPMFIERFNQDIKRATNELAKIFKNFNYALLETPYLINIIRPSLVHIEKEYSNVIENKRNGILSVPLTAFFGNMNPKLISSNEKCEIICKTNQINIDQLRVIHNSLNSNVTYVQGPPGTGKTYSIVNTIISYFFNGKTVLVSSNNNKPIDDIYESLKEIKHEQYGIIPLPILRLGNNGKVKETLKLLKEQVEKYIKFTPDEEKLKWHKNRNAYNFKTINTILNNYERKLALDEHLSSLKAISEEFKSDMHFNIIAQQMLNERQKEYDTIEELNEENVENLFSVADDSFKSWLFFTFVKAMQSLSQNDALMSILKIEDEDEKLKKFNDYLKSEFKTILNIFPIIMTTNQSAYRLGEPEPIFDLTIMDEAGQCSIGYSLLPIIRGKKLLLVGDPNQLRPIVTLNETTNTKLMDRYQICKYYNYYSNSILSVMITVDSVSKFILLRYHYRSNHKIINFSNTKYYNNRLKMKSKSKEEKPLEFISTDSSKETKYRRKNTSLSETDTIISHLKKYKPKGKIGIISPFKNQVNLIKDKLKAEGLNNIDVGTVHLFQGNEKDVIYLSPAITPNTTKKAFQFVSNNHELINVAATRAKEKLIIICDYSEIKRKSQENNDFVELCEYVHMNGENINITQKEIISYVNSINYKDYNSDKEKELLENLSHITTICQNYEIKEKVKISSVFIKNISGYENYFQKGEFDFVLYEKLSNNSIPRLAIELNGTEHYNDTEVMERDKIKEKICKDQNLKLIKINNDYSRRYNFIKENIIDMLKANA